MNSLFAKSNTSRTYPFLTKTEGYLFLNLHIFKHIWNISILNQTRRMSISCQVAVCVLMTTRDGPACDPIVHGRGVGIYRFLGAPFHMLLPLMRFFCRPPHTVAVLFQMLADTLTHHPPSDKWSHWDRGWFGCYIPEKGHKYTY